MIIIILCIIHKNTVWVCRCVGVYACACVCECACVSVNKNFTIQLPYHACICMHYNVIVSLGKQTRITVSMLWYIYSTYSIDDHATVFLERGMCCIHTSAPEGGMTKVNEFSWHMYTVTIGMLSCMAGHSGNTLPTCYKEWKDSRYNTQWRKLKLYQYQPHIPCLTISPLANNLTPTPRA